MSENSEEHTHNQPQGADSELEGILPVHEDCRYYLGEKPCKFKRHCPGCPHYEPFGMRILIIKLGAMGDVLRTTPVLRRLLHLYPNASITWLVKPEGVPLLTGNPYINRIWADDHVSTRRLMLEEFDLVLNFDKEPSAIAAMSLAKGKEKRGFGMNAHGRLTTMNPESDYALALGVSDELKFQRNTKSYQVMTFEMFGETFQGEEYVLQLSDQEKAQVPAWRKKLQIGEAELAIGLNTGAGDVFATKRLSPEKTAAVAREITERELGKVVLMGGPGERERNARIIELARGSVINSRCDNTLREFFALVASLDVLVCVDTLTMHVALALQKQVLVLFGPTCEQEVDLYGRGKKLLTGLECSPCYRQKCPYYDYCYGDISEKSIVDALEEILLQSGS